MAKYYEGDKPCPGCGRTGAEHPRLTKDGLCHECQELLYIGRTIDNERNLERNFYLMDELTCGYVTWYQIRNREIDRCLRNLLKTFSQFDRIHAGGYCRQETMLAGTAGCGTSADEFVLPKITFDAAKELCQTIESAVGELNREREDYKKRVDAELAEQKNDIYNDGVQHGRNLLFQLNNGEITAEELNKRIKKY